MRWTSSLDRNSYVLEKKVLKYRLNLHLRKLSQLKKCECGLFYSWSCFFLLLTSLTPTFLYRSLQDPRVHNSITPKRSLFVANTAGPEANVLVFSPRNGEYITVSFPGSITPRLACVRSIYSRSGFPFSLSAKTADIHHSINIFRKYHGFWAHPSRFLNFKNHACDWSAFPSFPSIACSRNCE